MSTAAALVVTNRPRFIEWFTHQIAKQTRKPDEVIVVTNARDSEAYLDGRMAERTGVANTLVYWQKPEPWVSLGWMRQKALDLCSSDILLWCDDDDWYHPRRFELSVAPIESGRYDAAAVPLTHMYYVEEQKIVSMECGVALHLPATAWRRSLVQKARFAHTLSGEDCMWICAIAHPPEGVELLLPPHRVRWIGNYIEPHIGAMVLVHGSNTWQISLSRFDTSEFAVLGKKMETLTKYAPKDVSQEEWDLTREMLEGLRVRR